MKRRAITKEPCGNCGRWRFLCGCDHENEGEWGQMKRRTMLWLADRLAKPEGPRDIVEFGHGMFGLADRSVICWEGENYVPQQASLRVRLHNWIVARV